jgi:AraC-like DNA-binding protein
VNDNFKYLTHNPEDRNWGLYLTVAGSARVLPDTDYPPAGHPTGYHFTWNNGRVLQEYQLNYITEGEGIMETHQGKYVVKEGSVILLRPNLWHRYKPVKNKGWMEHYIGFSGEFADRMVRNYGLFTESPVIRIGFHEDLVHHFQEVFNFVKSERPGYHQICSGIVVQLLGQIISIKKNENFRFSQVENSIQKACLMIRENATRNLDIENLAEELKINYSLFRKAFKKYTGLSPLQYHTSLRMKQAIYLLYNTDLSIKEISFSLGFCSVFYFSKLFKEKTGHTPSEYRSNNRSD